MPPRALLKVPFPTLAAEQPVANSRIADLAQQGIAPFDLGDAVKYSQGRDKRLVWRRPIRMDVSQSQKIRMLQRLVVVQPALIRLTAFMLPTTPPANFGC
jgi:hypothetical protein